jgi:hypothetical protein
MLAGVDARIESPRPFRGLLVPAILCLLTLGAYLTVYAWRARQPGGAIAFAVLGTSNTPGNRGYDGQYYYRIAVAPLGGRHGLDRPAYRYQRIGYPLLARAMALGDRGRIADTLVLVNVAAIALGTFFVALLLRRNGLSSLYAVPYAAYVGQVACFWRDLAEPLAYALVAAALLVWRVERLWPACLLLLAATLTKEAAILFTAAACAHLLLCGRWRALGTMAALAVLPYAIWQVALWRIFGQAGMAGTDHPPRLPLGGLTGARTALQLLAALPSVAIPALLCLGLALHGWRALWRNSSRIEQDEARIRRRTRAARVAWQIVSDFPTLALLANVALVLWLPARSYADLWASARNAQGMVLAALSYPGLATTRLRYPLALLWTGCAPLLWL